MFNAAPGSEILNGLSDLIEGGESLRGLANQLVETDVFKLVYSDTLNNAEFAELFVNNALSETSADVRALIIGDVEAILNSGSTRGELMVLAVWLLREIDSDDPVFGASATQFNNKVEVARYYSKDRGLSDDNLDDLQALLNQVSSLAGSVQVAKE
jgi:hypothetical protein